jgi:hypothetical protein
MAFLPKFADRTGYRDANIYQFERRREEPYRETSSVSWGPSPLQQGLNSRGMVDRVGPQKAGPDPASGMNPTAGLLGIQNTTGFSQEAPNVVYDYRPEEAAKDRKLQARELDIREMAARGQLENNAILNQTRMMNALSGQERAAIQRIRAENPNMVFQQTPEGIIALDPATGAAMNTGIGTGKMGREAEINLLQGGRMAQIGAQNQGQMNVQGLRNTGMMDVATANNAAALERLGYSRDTALQLAMLNQQGALNLAHFNQGQANLRQQSQQDYDKSKTIFQAEQGVYKTRNQATPVDRAWELYNTNPVLRPFLKFSADGKHVQVVEPAEKEGWFGGLQGHDPNTPTGEQYRMIQQGMYGDETPNMNWPGGGGNRGGTQSPTWITPAPTSDNNPPAINTPPSGAINQLSVKPEQQGLPSGLGLGGTSPTGGFFNLRNQNQGQGFSAAPGQYNAQPGQYNAPVGGQTPPQQGTNPQQNEQLKQQALALYQQKYPGRTPTEEDLAYVMQQLQTKQSTATPGQLSAGTVMGAPAGTLSGPSAGTVRR